MAPRPETIQRSTPVLALSVEDAAKALGIGRSLAYELVGKGEIPTIQLGTKRVVPLRLLEQKMEEWCLNARMSK